MAFKSEATNGGRELDAARLSEHGSHGGLLATLLSAVALGFSGFTYYDSSLKTADLTVYVPPMIHYGRDGEADVFNIPITIANEGARTGTVLTMELDVENLNPNAEKKTAKFHSAFLGDYPHDDTTVSRSFAPLSIPGHGTFTETVRFYPMDIALPYVVDDKGDYRLTLKLVVAKSRDPDFIEQYWLSEPKPLTFEATLPGLAEQYLSQQHGTQAMFNKNWQPAVSAPSEPARRALPESAAAPPNSELQPAAAPQQAAPKPQ
jgi:hypothetical protein